MAEVIDAHHHLWSYDPAEYGWISDEMQVLRRDFLPADLTAAMKGAGVAGTVAVQARQTVAETTFLLGCAAAEPAIRGVVGWLPIAGPTFPHELEILTRNPLLKGLRHVVQDEPDDRFLLGAAFNEGIAALQGSGLVYDILIYARHLPYAEMFVAKHTQQVFVLDHLAKPAVGRGDFAVWRDGLAAMARHPQVHCKISGLVTEADWSTWSLHSLRPYLDAALELFGAERLLAGSDWPVCLVASSYTRWWETLAQWAAPLTSRERDLFFGENAMRVYRLNSVP